MAQGPGPKDQGPGPGFRSRAQGAWGQGQRTKAQGPGPGTRAQGPMAAPLIINGCGIDIWAVGCVCAEVARGERLFGGTSADAVIAEIFRVVGSSAPGPLVKLPKYPSSVAASAKAQWPPAWLEPWHPPLIDFLSRLLVLNPCKRANAVDAADHVLFAVPTLAPVEG